MKIKSLTTRISLFVTILTTFVLLATLLTVYISSSNTLKDKAEEETQFKLDLMVQSLSKVQTSIESAATYSIPALRSCMSDTKAVMDILVNIVKKNQYVSSAAVAYAPSRLPGRSYCMPIAVKYGGIRSYYGDKETDGEYIYSEWYMVPSTKGEPFWTDPYSNELHIPVVSYAMPISGVDGDCEGVLTISIELRNFVDLLAFDRDGIGGNETKENNKYVLFDRNTTYLTTPHTEYIMNETLFTRAKLSNDTIFSHIGREIVADRDGQEIAEIDGEKSVVTWRILPHLQWTAMVETPYSEVFASMHKLSLITLIVALLATLIAVAVLVYAVRRSLRPLKRLQSAARQLGEGQYSDEKLPEVLTSRPDEIGELGREFERMETAVKTTISQLDDERQRVKDSNVMLTNLMQNVVCNLQMPINNMISFTDGLSALVDNSEEAQVIKQEAQKAGRTILQQFHQMNEMASLLSTNNKNAGQMIVIPSSEFMIEAMNGAHQLEERYMLTLTQEYHDKRSINIHTNPVQLETLLYQLIIEASKVSNTSVVGLYSMLNKEETALRIMIETKTANPIPAEEKANFFKRFAQQKIEVEPSSDYLQLFICYRTAKQLGARLYVDADYKEGNVFVLEIQKAD